MVSEGPTDRSKSLLLRAEVDVAAAAADDGPPDPAHVVTHTVDVSETTITLACDSLDVGARLRMKLSFPTLVEPFVIEAIVTSIDAQSGYGRPATTVCEVTHADVNAKRMLASLAAAARASASMMASAATATLGSYRCLLVEDNRFIRELFTYGMHRYCTARGADLTLEVANDAEGAWEMLGKERFDMAIIDHFLPAQTGAQLIARIRAEPSLSEIPVVAISVGGPEARQEAMGAGADLFLDKPVVLRELFSTLDKLTARCAAR
jgi:CheY-like chemotaxis protein